MRTNTEKDSILKRHIYLHRLGCPKIEADHDMLQSALESENVRFVDKASEADTVIVSTCAFIEDARIEAIDAILEAGQWKTEKEGRRLFVTGCLPLRHEAELRAEIPEVDDRFSFGRWNEVMQAVAGKELRHKKVSGVPSRHPGKIQPELEEELAGCRRHRLPFAYLRISEGCDRRCAYCAIPAMRGRYRSRPVQSILNEADRLLDDGVREIIIVAQEVNSYGRDPGTQSSIEELLISLGERMAQWNGERWLRILYTHPPLFTDKFVRTLKETPSLVPYLDFPVEHADDSVLKIMGRSTTWAQMRRWVERLRETIPSIALRTSVIVGHPGEGTREFDTLCSRLEEVCFDRLGIFRYSREEGTRAARLQAVDDEEARRREEILMSLAEEQAESWYASKPGMETAMLVEGLDEDGRSIGRSVWDAPDIDGIAATTEEVPAGEIIRGRIVAAKPFLLTIQPERERT